jgi:FAD-linked sulfhydryl oxidase
MFGFLSTFTSGFVAHASESPKNDELSPKKEEFLSKPDETHFLEKMKAEKQCGVCADPETLSQMKGLLENSDGNYRLPRKRKVLKPKPYSSIKYLYSSPEITPTGIHLGNFTDYSTPGASRRWLVNRENKAPREHVSFHLRYSQSELENMSKYTTEPDMEEYEIDYDIPRDPKQREIELGTSTENDVPIILHDDGSISPLHCPTTYSQLSRSTWTYLHTMAAYYPENADEEMQKDTSQFLKHFAKLYPCHHCKDHLVDYLDKNPPHLQNNRNFSVWMCEYHNNINAWLGKRIVQCNADYLLHRYKDGYPASANVQCNSDL